MQAAEGQEKQGERLLDSLHFPAMNARETMMIGAHPATFEWSIMWGSCQLGNRSSRDEHRAAIRANFEAWIRCGDPIYWIVGKPASRKSTLVNFIVKHLSIRQLLQQWCES